MQFVNVCKWTENDARDLAFGQQICPSEIVFKKNYDKILFQ